MEYSASSILLASCLGPSGSKRISLEGESSLDERIAAVRTVSNIFPSRSTVRTTRRLFLLSRLQTVSPRLHYLEGMKAP